jgi:hypothetical protein
MHDDGMSTKPTTDYCLEDLPTFCQVSSCPWSHRRNGGDFGGLGIGLTEFLSHAGWGDMRWASKQMETGFFAFGENRLVDCGWASCTGAVAAAAKQVFCMSCRRLFWVRMDDLPDIHIHNVRDRFGRARCKCADGGSCMHGCGSSALARQQVGS